MLQGGSPETIEPPLRMRLKETLTIHMHLHTLHDNLYSHLFLGVPDPEDCACNTLV